MDRIFEPDWKVFRQIKEAALNRLCQQILDEIAEMSGDESKSAHERYLCIYKIIDKRDEDIARGFDANSRSKALFQIASIYAMGLIEADEFERFSQATRDFVLEIVNPDS